MSNMKADFIFYAHTFAYLSSSSIKTVAVWPDSQHHTLEAGVILHRVTDVIHTDPYIQNVIHSVSCCPPSVCSFKAEF